MAEDNTLVIERVFKASPDEVWQALTNIDLLKQWLPFFKEFEARIGFETRFMLGRDESHRYEHICEVREVDPGKKLSYSWRFEGYPGDSTVSYELIPEGNDTKVRLSYVILEPFDPNNPDFKSSNFKEGWIYTIDGLGKFVEKKT